MFHPIKPARYSQNQAHPKVAQAMQEIYTRMGFADMDDFDAFWSKINRPGRDYVPYNRQADDPRAELIARAIAGESFQTKQIYRDLGYE